MSARATVHDSPIDLVLKVIEDSTLYYVQRVPAELGSIAWVIDRKNRKSVAYPQDRQQRDAREALNLRAPLRVQMRGTENPVPFPSLSSVVLVVVLQPRISRAVPSPRHSL